MGEAKNKNIQMFKKSIMFSDEEMSLIKNTFASDERLLNALRKHFLQFPMTGEEQEMVKEMTDDLIDLLKKVIHPELDSEFPLFQLMDGWTGIPLKDRNPESIIIDLDAKEIINQYLTERFKAIKGEDAGIELSSLMPNKDKDEKIRIVELHARNSILGQIDYALNRLVILAGSAKETVEQAIERLAKNSAQ